MISYNNKKIHDYRLGYLIDDAGNKLSFRCNILNRLDMQSIEILKNIDSIQGSITIRTTSNLPFKAQDKLLVNNMKYRVSSLYTEELDNYDGVIRNIPVHVTYLILIR